MMKNNKATDSAKNTKNTSKTVENYTTIDDVPKSDFIGEYN